MANVSNYSRSRRRFNRRRFLRGASVALALPWLESVPTLASNGGVSSSPPVRFASLFMANGVNVQHWHAHGNGTSMQLGDTLRPLDPFKEDIVFLRGLYNNQATLYEGAHLGNIPNVLSGAAISTRQNEIRVGVSMDQVVARQIGAQTDIPSLVLSHHFSNPTKLAMYQKTNEFHIGQFAYLIRRLKEVREGERALLDNSKLLFCSSLMDGNKHDATQMPMLLAGRGGGAITTGRTLDYSNKEDNHRRACSLYLSLMDHMGVSLDHFGDADSRLAEI